VSSQAEPSTRMLVVCAGNRGRSPLAAAILRRLLAERSNVALDVSSAGLCTYEIGRSGMPADVSCATVAAEHGLDLSRHLARPLTPEMYDGSAFTITMETWQSTILRTAFPGSGSKVYTLRELVSEPGSADLDTPDIAGLPASDIRAFFQEAERVLTAAVEAGPLAEFLIACASALEPRAACEAMQT
jgi:protein-tyrosine-phosphatase